MFRRIVLFFVLGVLASGCSDDSTTPILQEDQVVSSEEDFSLVDAQLPDLQDSNSGLELIFGPKRFFRGKVPLFKIEEIDVTGFESPFLLHVFNGTLSGQNRVRAAFVFLDGRFLLGPRDFKRNQFLHTVPVEIDGTSTRLKVIILGGRNTFLHIALKGTPEDTSVLFCPGGTVAGAFEDLNEAIAATEPSGTLQICDGTHQIPATATVNQPITIEPEPGAAPVLDIGGAPGRNLFSIGQIQGVGDVVIRGLELVNGTQPHINIASDGNRQIIIEDSRFVGEANLTAHILFGPNAEGIVVQDNEFIGGRNGIFGNPVASGPGLTVINNIFNGQTQRAASGSIDRFEGNQALCENPGSNCVNIAASPGSPVVTVAGNILTADISQRANNAIVVSMTNAPTGAELEIRDNQILGTGVVFDRDGPSQTLPWGAAFVVSDTDPTKTVSLAGNRAANVGAGFFLFNLAGSLTGSDNDIDGANTLFAIGGGVTGPIELTRNDFFIRGTGDSSVFLPGSMLCNWWGFADPLPFFQRFGVDQGAVVPFSAVPIAGNPAVPCSTEPPAIVRVSDTPVPGSIPTFPTLNAAHAVIAQNGTILMADEVHEAEFFEINKPVTIEAESGTPVLDGLPIRFRLSEGSAVIRGLQFRNVNGRAVTVSGNAYDEVIVEDSEFIIPNLSFAQGVNVSGAATLNSNRVIVQRNRFQGGPSGFGIISGFANDVEIIDNEFTGVSVSGFFSRFDRNTLLDCVSCLTVSVIQGIDEVSVSNNDITVNIDDQPGTPRAITIQGQNGSAENATIIVEGNSILGIGGAQDPTDPQSFPLEDGILFSRIDDSSVSLRNNRIAGARTGMSYLTGSLPSGTSLDASDNVIDGVFTVLNLDRSQGGDFTVNIHRNDFLGYERPMELSGVFPPGILTCNWWGDPSGPIDPFPGKEQFFTPFSTVPIANDPTVICP